MKWLERISKGVGLLDKIGTLVAGASDLADARRMLAEAAQRGDLDGSLQHVLAGQARASTYERTGR